MPTIRTLRNTPGLPIGAAFCVPPAVRSKPDGAGTAHRRRGFAAAWCGALFVFLLAGLAEPVAAGPGDICGDGALGITEVCDDGNAVSNDGCSANCMIVEEGFICPGAGLACQAICGDALVRGAETCDDNNVVNGDGCSGTCTVEPGFACPTPGEMCVMRPRVVPSVPTLSQWGQTSLVFVLLTLGSVYLRPRMEPHRNSRRG